MTVTTPHGGRHLYFQAPAARPVLSSSGGRAGLGPGIDVRGPDRRMGGYLIGPGSVVHGARYTLTCDLPPAELPTWVLDRLQPPQAPYEGHTPATGKL